MNQPQPAKALRFAVFVEGQEGLSWEEWSDIAKATLRGGFEALLQSDHHLSTQDETVAAGLDPWATIPALAATVSGLRLGTLVSPVGFRHPLELARLASSADLISKGRIEVGVGAGWYEREHRAYGLPFADAPGRFDRLEEQLLVLRKLWSGETSSFSGQFQLLDAPPLPRDQRQPAGPPLIVGADGGPRSIALAARWADEYNLRTADPQESARVRRALDEAAAACGRDPSSVRLSVLVHCIVGSRWEEAEQIYARSMPARSDESTSSRARLESRRQRALIGDFPHALEQARMLHHSGVDRLIIQVPGLDDPGELETLGKELLREPPPAEGKG